jgi:hypothetical protein
VQVHIRAKDQAGCHNGGGRFVVGVKRKRKKKTIVAKPKPLKL